MTITNWLTVVILVLVLLVILFTAVGLKLLTAYYNSLKKVIRDSVQAKFIDISPSTQSLIEAAIEVWRLEKRLGKIAGDLSDDQNKAFENSVTKLKRYLDTNDITFTDYTDQKYNEGLNLDILNIEKDSNVKESAIKETHEPAVFHKGQLIKKAKVVVIEK